MPYLSRGNPQDHHSTVRGDQGEREKSGTRSRRSTYERASEYLFQRRRCGLIQSDLEAAGFIIRSFQGVLCQSRAGKSRMLGMDRVRGLILRGLTCSVSNTRMPVYDTYGFFSAEGQPICVNCLIAHNTPVYSSKRDVSFWVVADKLATVCLVCSTSLCVS